MDAFNKDFVKDAAELLHHVNDICFSPSFAIFAITADEHLASDECSIKAADFIRSSMGSSQGRITDKKSLSAFVWKKVKKLPNISKKPLREAHFDDFRDRKIPDVMRLVRYSERDIKNNTFYKNVARYIVASEKSTNDNITLPLPIRIEDTHHALGSGTITLSLQSPVSALSSPSESSFRTDSTLQTDPTIKSKSTSSSSAPSAVISKLLDLPETRRSITEAQKKRAEDSTLKKLYPLALKVASHITHDMRSRHLPVEHLNTAVKTANEVNKLFGLELLAGSDINRHIKQDRVGKSPPRQGPPRRICQNEFELICDLVFTCFSIEQANGDPNRLDRPHMQSAITDMVNTKLQEDGKDSLQAVHFYGTIQDELSRELKLSSPTYREALRAAWTTYENQRDNYLQWESWLCELGFGRPPKDEDERRKYGNVVLYEDQKRRILQFDEMGFSFDGSKNGKGGRPAAVTTNPDVSDPKQPTYKSNHKITCMFGMNFEYEALPPMFVVTSKAEEPRLRKHLLTHMRHTKGQFGYKKQDEDDFRSWPACIAFGKEGSIDTESLIYWVEEHLTSLYPDAEDTPGKRVMMKADMGPGRMDEAFRCISRSYGFYFFAGLPNGTEIGQEMDQLFAVVKTLMEKNREQLWNARYSYLYQKATTSTWDLPYIVFGGKVKLENNIVIQLTNAFNDGLRPARLQRAAEKCGYIPATQALLDSDLLLRKVSTNEGIDGKKISFSDTMVEMQKRNHAVVTELIEEGYAKAIEFKRYTKKESKKTRLSEEDITVPNTRRRQEKLMGIRHAGDWFKATSGGAPINCDDAIIAIQRERINEERMKLEKIKKSGNARSKAIKAGDALRDKKGPNYNPKGKKQKNGKLGPNWTLNDLKVMIKLKNPSQSKMPSKRSGLEEIWEKVKDCNTPRRQRKWKQRDEDVLAEFNDGGRFDISRVYVMRRAERRKVGRLSSQISALHSNSALQVLGRAIQKLPDDIRRVLLDDDGWRDPYLGDDSSTSTVSSVHTIGLEEEWQDASVDDSDNESILEVDGIEDIISIEDSVSDEDSLSFSSHSSERENDIIAGDFVPLQGSPSSFSSDSSPIEERPCIKEQEGPSKKSDDSVSDEDSLSLPSHSSERENDIIAGDFVPLQGSPSSSSSDSSPIEERPCIKEQEEPPKKSEEHQFVVEDPPAIRRSARTRKPPKRNQ